MASKTLLSSPTLVIIVTTNKRGCAIANGIIEKMVMSKKKVTIIKGFEDTSSSSWLPNPITGYYCPGGRAGSVDCAELRKILLPNYFKKYNKARDEF